jgi:hypothetical protein
MLISEVLWIGTLVASAKIMRISRRNAKLCGLVAVVLLTCGAVPIFAQDDAARKLTGTWEAKFHNTVFSVLKLEMNGDAITGTLSAGNIQVDQDGALVGALPTDEVHPIFKPRIEAGGLLFEWSDAPGENRLKLQLKIVSDNRAELRFLTAPGGGKIQPFQFAKRD